MARDKPRPRTPEGWPRSPKFNEPGDVPGPPVQYGDPQKPENAEGGLSFIDNGVEENNLYFYHPDHLGSSSYISNKQGDIIQHTEYMAFGEVLFDEHSVSTTMPYLFNGKELDSETGLYYYGARYYDPRTSIWLNVDPLAEKYPNISPYAYVANNPVMLVDPDGREVVAYDKETQNAIIEYITDQLGENNGFYFNKKGVLKYRNDKLEKVKKEFNDEQKSIAEGLVEVVDNKDRVIEVYTSKDSDEFTVSVYEPGFVMDEKGRFVMDENGAPKREGWRKTDYEVDLSTKDTGGALFWGTGKLDKTKQAYGYIVINRKKASMIEIKGVEGKLTRPSESSVFIHEILDHGLDFIRNGNINKSSGAGVENVKFHNQALKNISKGESPLRNSHYDKK